MNTYVSCRNCSKQATPPVSRLSAEQLIGAVDGSRCPEPLIGASCSERYLEPLIGAYGSEPLLRAIAWSPGLETLAELPSCQES
jgi:hypothetical protein